MSSSEEDILSFSCQFCEEELDSSFFLCSRLHFSCVHCSSLGGFCPQCHTIQVFCCDLKDFEASNKGPLFERAGNGPIIAFPDIGDLEDQEKCQLDINEDPDVRKTRMYNCHDCGKFLTSARLTEHYIHEHPKIHICPLLPGACLSFRLKLDDVPCQKIKRIQIMKLINYKQLTTGYDSDDPVDDNILFIMAVRVPFFETKTAVLLWLSSCYPGSSLTYSIEARGENNKIASAMFTGTPIGPNVMDEVTKGTLQYEDLGQYLCVKDSLLKAFEKDGENVLINTIIHSK